GLWNQFMAEFPEAMNTFETLVSGNTLWQSRTMGIGVISAEDAIDWGLTGPCLRGSGVDLDLRRANPYTGYETYDFDIPVEHDGDVWARFRRRMRNRDHTSQIGRAHLCTTV